MKKFWNFCKAGGALLIIGGAIVGVIWGIGYGILALEHSLVDYKAEVDLVAYGTKFDGYMLVCQRAGVPVTVCVLAWPNGARK